MRKMLGLLLVVMLLLGLVPLAVYAVPATAYADLAAYFPPETSLYLAMGTSDDDIARLDVLLQMVAAAAPDEMPPGIRLVNLLDMGALEVTGEDFQNGMRSWLGDTLAFGLLDINSLLEAAMPRSADMAEPEVPPFLVAVDIIDRLAAERAVENLLTYANLGPLFTVVGGASYTVFKSTDPSLNVSIVITADALLLGDKDSTSRVLEQIGSPSLADEAGFTGALELLPADGYNLLFYVNAEQLTALALEQAIAEGVLTAEAVPPVTYPTMALGVAVLDEQALALDVVYPIGDLSNMAETALVFQPLPPVDFAFARHIPADALLTMQGSDLLALFEMAGEGIEMGLLQFVEQMAYMPEMDDLPPGFDFDPSEILTDIEVTLAEFQQEFTAATGLDIAQDILRWMDGNFAFFLSVNGEAALADPMTEMPISIGSLVETSDPAAAQQAVAGLATGLERLLADEEIGADEVTLERSTIGAADVVLITPVLDEGDPPVVLGFGADDQVFAEGTLEGLQAIFEPQGGGLAAAPRFITAQQFMVAEPSALFYFDIHTILPTILAEADPYDLEDMELVFSLFQTMAVSGTTFDDGSSMARVSIVLGTQ
ncbi:DUF3352 domain-containing protein, partial [Chloroflexota bacterium]